MAGTSGEEVNYNLRPAKQIERKMLCETFHRLAEFGAVSSYRYVGFGSFYFSDFVLFHKELGISNMVSIEKGVDKKDRFLFNQPFDCIRVKFGHSNEVLPTLDWDVRTILWLDCDYPLDLSVLTDVSWFCANAVAGSILVVTVDARADLGAEDLLKELADRIGEERVPVGTTTNDLKGWGSARIARKVIKNHMCEELGSRNGGRPNGSRFVYRQLFNFQYADRARMLTVGGVLYDEGQKGKVDACGFGELGFVRSGEEPYKVEVPKLTYRELLHLDAQLPVDDPKKLEAKAIPERDLKRYAQVYRYFPNFMEIARGG